MNLLLVILSCIAVVLLAFLIRVKPIWKNRYSGCDAYYYLLCVEEFRKHKRLPIILPDYYLLDIQEQWYPPGFVIFLSLLPKRFVEKYYWAIAPAIDCLTIALLYTTTYLLSGGIIVATIASLLYTLTLAVIVECSSLNSRPLGSFLLVATLLCIFAFAESYTVWFLLGYILFGVCLLMTHKMSAQLLYFILPLMSLIFWDPTYIAALLGIVAVTFLLFRSFFIKVLKGQWDILTFWNRNWKNLGAHQVYSSPIYGNESREDLGRIFQKGFKGLYRNARSMGLNITVILLIFPILHYSQLLLFDKQMLWLVILAYALAGATLLIPQLRFYGEGFKYLRMVAFPIAYLAITPLLYNWDVILHYQYSILPVTLIVSLWITLRTYKSTALTGWGSPSMGTNLNSTLEFLKNNSEVDAIMVIPLTYADTIAYHCRKKVVWGTHSYNFKVVEPFYPVLRKPLESFISEYNISHIMLDANHTAPETLQLSPVNRVFNAGHYQIYKTKEE